VGSGAHGLAVSGKDDHDEMGICFEDEAYVIGLKKFEQSIFRTATEDGRIRSGPGDTDRTIYSMRKWMLLALNNNPTILSMLWAPVLEGTYTGEVLREMAPEFIISTRAAKAYAGYMADQLKRLKGEQGNMRVHRPELVEEYGFDTKYAMHIVRLGLQGTELMAFGKISYPMVDELREVCYNVRTGKYTYDEVLELADVVYNNLLAAEKESTLRKEPDYLWANKFLVAAYQKWWGN
jgi:predicted nucleotidyltransferase